MIIGATSGMDSRRRRFELLFVSTGFSIPTPSSSRIRSAAMAWPTATATAPKHSFDKEEFSMADTANHLIPEQGKFRRALAAVFRFLGALESTPFDYTLDRIERLEREVGRLKDELHQVQHSGAVDA